MPATVVVGAQWGDEGKGKIVDLLAQHVDIVCRYQGGPNGQWWHPHNYVDWGRMAHDLETSGDVYTIEPEGGGVHVFNNH